MHKLSKENSDFKQFLKSATKDIKADRIDRSLYDKVIDDPSSYIKKTFKSKE